jgi:hypothetical protein
MKILCFFRKAVIKGRQRENFTMFFESERLGEFRYVLIGKPSLIDGQSAEIEDLAVHISATTIKPCLELDKRVINSFFELFVIKIFRF